MVSSDCAVDVVIVVVVVEQKADQCRCSHLHGGGIGAGQTQVKGQLARAFAYLGPQDAVGQRLLGAGLSRRVQSDDDLGLLALHSSAFLLVLFLIFLFDLITEVGSLTLDDGLQGLIASLAGGRGLEEGKEEKRGEDGGKGTGRERKRGGRKRGGRKEGKKIK